MRYFCAGLMLVSAALVHVEHFGPSGLALFVISTLYCLYDFFWN